MLSACATTDPPHQHPQPQDASDQAGAEDKAKGPPETAAPPFTAEEIREATGPGRTYTFRVEQPDTPTMILEMKLKKPDDKGVMLRRTMTSEETGVGEASEERVSWDELEDHASWPKDATELSEAATETPAGRFEGPLYTISTIEDGKPLITRAWFAGDLPGPPVRLRVEHQGTTLQEMILLSYQSAEDDKTGGGDDSGESEME